MDQRRRTRTLYIILLTQALSMIGSRISGLAVGFEVFAQTGLATTLTLVAFFGILPSLLAAGFAGVLSDRWDRRKILMLSDAGQAVATVFLMFSFATGSFQVWHLYAVTLAQSIFGAFQWPAMAASVTMLVPDEHRDRANMIQQLTGPLAGIIAPPIAGVVFAIMGVTGAIAIDLITFLVAVGVMMVVAIPQPKRKEHDDSKKSVWRDMVSGFQILWDMKPLLILALLMTVVTSVLNGILTLLTPYLLTRLGSGNDAEAITGVLLAVMNISALVGGVTMAMWGNIKNRMRAITIALSLMALMVVALGAARTAPVLGVVLFVMMLPMTTANALVFSMLQAKIAPDVQGRVFAAVSQIAQVLMPFAFLVVGPLADNVFEPAVGQAGWSLVAPLVGDTVGSGMGLMFVIAGLIVFGFMMVIYAVPSVRNLETLLPDVLATERTEDMPAVSDDLPESEFEPVTVS